MGAAVRLLLAPGASGTVAGLGDLFAALATRGVHGTGVALPKGTAERALPVYRAEVDEAERGALAIAIGGQSFGGRVASIVAAERQVAGLVLLSYPLHAPGRREAWDERTAHWPRISCPVLLLSGEADPFANLPLLRDAIPRLAHGELVTYPRLGHTLRPVQDDVVERVARFVSELGGG